MEKAHTKSALKLVKASSQSAVQWSNTARGMAKDELNKDRLYDKSKPLAKENTKPQEFKLHTSQRAYKRAMFNYSVATKLYLNELQKKQIEKIQKIIEEEEVRMLRKEMIPRAQLMPFFDRPFFPQRSNRPLTIPREPSFHMLNSKCWSCQSAGHELYHFQHAQAWSN
ncbi:protein TPX2 isoform X2 [Ricinus communis]|uniref:protein TPX2 isoform X2 n=1 Tax=Ricinus communis TaxID=3988 RepID=UPI0007728BB7|nr:protein TPX2 isoform X2 [Ricinus communis]|eukprot:XP_015580432.1 protein TPX2 isoform X2 [Ricinus communis]